MNASPLRILLAGNWQWQIYEAACAAAFEQQGHEVVAFQFHRYFAGRLGRAQAALAALPGPAAYVLNRALLESVREHQPDLVLVWRGTHVWPGTLRALRNEGCALVSYNNDDPFGSVTERGAPWHHRYLWTWYVKALPEYHVNFVYRPGNVAEAEAAGGKNVSVLPPYFIPHLHHPVALTDAERERYECDVVFIGHYEPDGREQFLAALVRAGLRVRLFGGAYWTREVLGDLADYFGEVKPVAEGEYAKALRGAKMCLAFLSRMNRDVYTRRCFEIPACGRTMLCQRTVELGRLFRDNEEAVFFSTPEELVQKALELRSRPDELARIALAGLRRVHADGHDVGSRMRQMLEHIPPSRRLAARTGRALG